MPFTLPIPKLHGEHCLWVNELNFYKVQLSHFQRRLKKYASDILIPEQVAALKNFRQQIHQLHKSIIMLEMELNEQEKILVNFIKEVSGMGLNSFKMDNHVISREKMEILRRSVIALNRDFRLFETKCKSLTTDPLTLSIFKNYFYADGLTRMPNLEANNQHHEKDYQPPLPAASSCSYICTNQYA